MQPTKPLKLTNEKPPEKDQTDYFCTGPCISEFFQVFTYLSQFNLKCSRIVESH
uniref:Uncharacterized protein n=1 Tax=Anguilla anguilla TaxID=7936 RepID=A0A0E9PUL9_ANGAN